MWNFIDQIKGLLKVLLAFKDLSACQTIFIYFLNNKLIDHSNFNVMARTLNQTYHILHLENIHIYILPVIFKDFLTNLSKSSNFKVLHRIFSISKTFQDFKYCRKSSIDLHSCNVINCQFSCPFLIECHTQTQNQVIYPGVPQINTCNCIYLSSGLNIHINYM